MDFVKPGDIISIRHYSGINPFNSIVVDIDGDAIRVKLTKDFAIMNFLEGDPVVFGIETNGQIHMIGCNITKIDSKEEVVEVVIDKVDTGSDQRRHERFPVSLYADIRTKFSKKKHLAAIKDISYYGMLVYSKSDFTLGEQIEIDIYMEKKMVFLKGDIVRKTESPHYTQYGLRIVYEDINTMNFMKEYLKRLKESHEDSVKKIRDNEL
ncbi:MAG: PilZ domain-containing protein [Bacillota bacterium]